MSRRIAATFVAALVWVLVAAGAASAAPGGSSGADVDNDTGELAPWAAHETRVSYSDDGGDGQGAAAGLPRPRCTWSLAAGIGGLTGTFGQVRDRTTRQPAAVSGPNTETLMVRHCPGQSDELSWVPDDAGSAANVEALISRARRTASAQVPLPEMDMNPAPSVGGTVNIGLWLAVENPGVVSVTASLGPVWATVTARYVSTTWEMGNGDVVECEGLGTPIVDLDTVEEGPCGYTYLWPSAPNFTSTDDLAYHASVTGHWAITYATSTGSAGTLPTLDRTTDFLYQVRELQTLRVSDDG